MIVQFPDEWISGKDVMSFLGVAIQVPCPADVSQAGNLVRATRGFEESKPFLFL